MELSREQLIELVLGLAARVAELEARLGQPPKTPGNSSVPPPRSLGQAAGFTANRAERPARAPSAFGGSFVDNQDARPPSLEVGAECYAGFSSFLYSRMSPG